MDHQEKSESGEKSGLWWVDNLDSGLDLSKITKMAVSESGEGQSLLVINKITKNFILIIKI